MAGMIMGLTTLVGFDSAANLAEEAKDPFRSVPRAIVASVVAAAVLGLLFLIALTVAIKDIADGHHQRVTGRGDHRGTSSVRWSSESCWPVWCSRCSARGWWSMAACSRQVFAMARDARFPAHTTDAAGQPTNQDPDPGDDPDPGRGSDLHGRAARGRRCCS